MNRSLVCLLAILLVGALSACGGSRTVPDNTPSANGDEEPTDAVDAVLASAIQPGGNHNSGGNRYPDSAPAEPAYTPYPTEVRSAFLNECSPSGGQATCECVLQKMERSIPLEQLARNEVPKDQLATWVQECLAN